VPLEQYFKVCLHHCIFGKFFYSQSENPVDLLAMRVGFIKQLLWERYGNVWRALIEGVNAEVLEAEPAKVLAHFEAQSPSEIPGLPFRLAVAEALALSDADLLVVPDLNPNETILRGSGQDPWTASFPETLQRIAGLPRVLKVPATLTGHLEPLVLETLLSVVRDPALVRRVWERALPSLKPKRHPEIRWARLPGQKETAAVIGQPWLMTNHLSRLLGFPETQLVLQNQINPGLLREEAKRLEQRLVATDAEVLGAAHFFNRKGNVDKLIMMVDTTSGPDLWLEKHVRKIVSKPLEIIYLETIVSRHGLAALLNPT
jgi:hypothetical protein